MTLSYLLSKEEFIYGLIAGIAISIIIGSRLPMRKRLHIEASVILVEDLLKSYRNDGVNGISNWLLMYSQKKVVRVWGIWSGKGGPSAFRLWAAIVTYIAYKFATMSSNAVSDDIETIVEVVFDGYGVQKYKAIFDVINRSVPYLVSENKSHYFEMVACMIDSTTRDIGLNEDMMSRTFPK